MLVRVGFLFPRCRSRGSNSDPQGFVASPFTHWVVSLAPVLLFKTKSLKGFWRALWAWVVSWVIARKAGLCKPTTNDSCGFFSRGLQNAALVYDQTEVSSLVLATHLEDAPQHQSFRETVRFPTNPWAFPSSLWLLTCLCRAQKQLAKETSSSAVTTWLRWPPSCIVRPSARPIRSSISRFRMSMFTSYAVHSLLSALLLGLVLQFHQQTQLF